MGDEHVDALRQARLRFSLQEVDVDDFERLVDALADNRDRFVVSFLLHLRPRDASHGPRGGEACARPLQHGST
jgi:hypothetical protein